MRARPDSPLPNVAPALIDSLMARFADADREAGPDLDALLRERPGVGLDPAVIVGLAKIDMDRRIARGERVSARDYLDRFSCIAKNGERAISLIYEEFCLLAECGRGTTPSEFCERYPTWRDSLISQLGYHQMLSRLALPGATPPPFPALGDEFEGYRLSSVLGQGGAAKVYLARELALAEREVALKISWNRGGEHTILGRLDHANIVPVLAVKVQERSGLRAISMPYRPGTALDQVFRALGKVGRPRSAQALWDLLPSAGSKAKSPIIDESERAGWNGFPRRGSYAEAVAWIALKLTRAIAHAHQRGILHRDVKPANILLTFREGPQLLDFNLAHDPSNAAQAQDALRGGTLPYMAPEQLQAFLDPLSWQFVGPAADLYSLGLVIREFLTLKPLDPSPQHRDDSPAALPRVIRQYLDRRAIPPRPIRSEAPEIPYALEAILGRCLEFDQAKRYADASELAEDLASFLASQPLKHVKNPSMLERGGNRLRRARYALGVTAAFGLMLGLSTMLSRPTDTYSTVDLAIKAEDWPKVKKILDDARILETNNTPRLIDYGMACLMLGRSEEGYKALNKAWRGENAVPAFEAAVIKYQSSVPIRLGLGNAYLIQRLPDGPENERRLASARECFEAGAANNESRSIALQGLGHVAFQQKDYAEAVKWFSESIRFEEQKGAEGNPLTIGRSTWMKVGSLETLADLHIQAKSYDEALNACDLLGPALSAIAGKPSIQSSNDRTFAIPLHEAKERVLRARIEAGRGNAGEAASHLREARARLLDLSPSDQSDAESLSATQEAIRVLERELSPAN